MSTLSGSKQTRQTILHSNPVLSRVSKGFERTEGTTATYAGIAGKTFFFLLISLVGIGIQLLVAQAFASAPAWFTISVIKGQAPAAISKTEGIIAIAVLIVGFISELVAIFGRKTTPVTGSIYAASQGYVISMLVFKLLGEYSYLGLEALLLTIAVVGVMSFLYTRGIVRDGKTFRIILMSLVFGTIALGLLSLIAWLLPFSRSLVVSMSHNVGFCIAMDVVGLIIAAMFLISDFSMIDECVKNGYPKEYEWSAAFGLVFTVLWIYLKILDLLIQITNSRKSS